MKRKFKILGVVILVNLLALVFVGCAAYDRAIIAIESTLFGIQPRTRPTIPSDIIVYAVGQAGNDAVYWRNEEFFALPRVGVGAAGEIATSIVVSGNDVYIAGMILYSATTFEAVYWRNGIPVRLSRGDARVTEATSIVASGNDVFITGRADNEAVYWKNDQLFTLSRIDAERAVATSLVVIGTEVWVSGYLVYSDGGTAITQAVYWRDDGRPVTLSHGAVAERIAILGNDVYITGWAGRNAVFWRNGQLSNLRNPSSSWDRGERDARPARANSIFISGNDVYIAGWGETVNSNSEIRNWGAYWKNGQFNILEDQSDDGRNIVSHGGNVRSIFVLDNNVYSGGHTIGWARDYFNRATIWMNEWRVLYLFDPRASGSIVSTIVRDIYVVKRD